MHTEVKNRRACQSAKAATLAALAFVYLWATVPAGAEPGVSIPPADGPRWQFTISAPEKDTLAPLEYDANFIATLAPPLAIVLSPWALDLDSRYLARPDSLDLQTYLAFRDHKGVREGWNKNVNSLLRKTELQRRGELRIGIALPKAVESIVGEGGAGLKVSGYRKILFTGRSQWTDKLSTATVRQSKFPSLTMEQISKFTVEGQIGSKITVKVDQDSKRTTDLDNRLIIRYKGDEDDILQSVDLGNTQLALSDARFIGYSERIQGLFGIGATAKMGPVDIKMIASQEKGNTSTNRLTAGANEQKIIIRDFAFDRFRFFDLGIVGDSNVLSPGDTIYEFILYQNANNQLATIPFALAYPDWIDRDNAGNLGSLNRYQELSFAEPSEYLLDPTQFFIHFPRRLTNIENKSLAYYMVFRRASDGAIVEIGTLNDGTEADPHELQLLKPIAPRPDDPLWEAEWKNVYDLRIRNIKYEDLDLDIFKGLVGDEENPANLDHQNGTQYLQLLGLDQQNTSGSGGPDGKIDDNRTILDLENGLLFFGERFPFSSDALTRPVSGIYVTNNSQEKRDSSKYYIQITTRQRSSQIRLGVVDIISGSEVITYNGRRLNRGSDYNIDYEIGTVEFLRDDVLDPNATVTIDYEYAPFLTVEKRSLFGMSARYDGGPNLSAGGTMLYKGTKSTDRPAQLGQEPYRDIVAETFLNWRAQPGFLTDFANSIPLVDTKTPSRLDIQGAIARSMPNPNTKDVVYVDDFEGAKRAQSLGILRETWTLASPPLAEPGGITDKRRIRGNDPGFLGLSDPGFTWTNPFPQFEDTQIYDRDSDRANARNRNTHVLIMELRPHESPTLMPGAEPIEAWGGVMRALPVGAWDQSRAEFLELRMAVSSLGSGSGVGTGTLHLDLGQISEDINADDILNTEDLRDAAGNRNRILDDGEDLGLDGLPDSSEVGPNGEPYDPVSNPDPAFDNWPEDESDARTLSEHPRINGTEINFRDPVRGLRPDTEDIGGPSEFDRINSYYEFSIDLGDAFDPALVPNTDHPSEDRTGFSADGLVWKTYRIPLWDGRLYDAFFEGSGPDSSVVQYARLWLDSADTTVRVYIAAVEIVERTWATRLELVDTTGTIDDEAFRIGVVNTEENLDYVSPPDVAGYHDPRTGFDEKEQSLLLEYENLRPGDAGVAFLQNSTIEDYTGYRTLSMWINADSAEDGNTVVFLRIGQDKNNYYYYEDTLVHDPDIADNWRRNRMVIDFNALTALKDTTVRGSDGRGGVYDPVSKLGVVGIPSLSNVLLKEIGLRRLDDAPAGPHSGRVWCDELELSEVRKDPGIAVSGKLTLQVADLLGFTALLESRDYSFRGLTSGRSNSVNSGSSSNKRSLNGNLRLDKFLPAKLKITLPLAVTYSKTVRTPRLLTGSDVILTPDRQEDERSTTIAQGFSTRFAMKPDTKNWLVNSTVSALRLTFSANKSRSWSPTIPVAESETYRATANYNLNIGNVLSFPALYWTRLLLMPRRIWETPFTLLPTSFTATGNISRRRGMSLNSRGLLTRSYNRDFVGNASLKLQPVPRLSVQYNMTTTRDLANPDELNLSFNPKAFRLGRETGFTQRLSTNYQAQLLPFLSPSFSYSANFRDNVDKQFGDHDVNLDRTWQVGGNFNLNTFWTTLGARKGTKRPVNRPRRPEPVQQQQPQAANGTDADSTTAKPPAPKKTSGGGIGVISAWRNLMLGMKWVTTPVGPLNVTFSRGNGDFRRNLLVRPSPRYQFGLDLDEEVPIAGGASNSSLAQQDTRSTREGLSIKNSFRFFGVLTFKSTYTISTSTSLRAGAETRKESETFPSLSTSLNRLERFKPIGWVLGNARADFNYTRKSDRTFQGNQRNNRTETQNFAPLFKISGTTRNGMQVSFQMDKSSSLATPNSSSTTQTKTSTKAMRASTSYSFSSPNGIPIPFLRGIRLKSRMSISLNFTYKTTQAFTGSPSIDPLTGATGSVVWLNTQDNVDLTIGTRANYSFSTRVRGGMNIDWTDRSTKGSSTGRQKTHIRALSIWAEFSF